MTSRFCFPARATRLLILGVASLLAARAAAQSDAPAAAEPVVPPPPPASLAIARLTLDEAIARALRNNQRIKVSEYGRGIARANVLAQYGRFDPALTFRRFYSESELALSPTSAVSAVSQSDEYAAGLEGLLPLGTSYQIGGSSQNQRGTYNNFSNRFVTFGGISVTQPLLRGFGFGANLAGLRIAKADRSISDWEYRQAVIDTVTSVVLAYNDLAEARENLRIARRSRDLAAKLVSDNERRNRVGSLSDADVTQARARVANREEFILIAQRNIKNVENRLRTLIGAGEISPNPPDLAIEPLALAPPMTADGATDLQRALTLRPDYQAARQGLVKGRANRSFALNQMLPRVDFVGSYGYNGIDPSFAGSRAQVRNRDNRAYSTGVVVSVPLTFAEGRGRYRAAKLGLLQAEADVVRLEQDIAVSVANAIGQLETAAERVQATTRAHELAQQALDAEEKRFRAGTSSTFLVLQLQEQLTAVESNRVRAIADQHRAQANYQREIGATLQARQLTVE